LISLAMAIYNLCILKIQNRCTTQNPSIIIINTMEIKLAKTIEQYLVRLIKEELQFVSTPYN